jgi:hypothetical protein
MSLLCVLIGHKWRPRVCNECGKDCGNQSYELRCVRCKRRVGDPGPTQEKP